MEIIKKSLKFSLILPPRENHFNILEYQIGFKKYSFNILLIGGKKEDIKSILEPVLRGKKNHLHHLELFSVFFHSFPELHPH